ncbi:D-3-phosphoglycerate dehydrogenase [Planctomycetes bacterium Pan216]|uniref:D-3-phosphoglycerate dehydrogenase n=1 Tax=Kolteria novifilia TaxID=2527975 RepID=A0A518BAA8_9BACT|nr:D-3-phosphoglycerate dehydrogenase [Planctomycetes bacterium Pan216]
MHRVLISDPLAEEGLRILEAAEGIEVVNTPGLKGDELKSVLAECDGVIIRSGTTITADLLQRPSKLRVIVRAGAGVDNIEVPAATREGIVVMNTPGGNTLSTAEHTIALLLALSRHVPAADLSLREGRWDRKKYTGSQLAGKTLGVIGLGRVGLAVAKRAIGLEMNILGYDPFLSAERAAELGIESVSDPEDIYPRADIVTVHVPLGEQTKGMVGKSQMAKLRKGAAVINCARGGIVDEDALLEALESGHLSGAALDVYSSEPCTDSPLFKLPNVVVTPHLGASTQEAQLNVAIEAANLIVNYLQKGNIRFAVNMASLEPSELEEARRHLDICRRLGLFQAQLAKGAISKATITYQGEAAKKKTSLLTTAFAMGLLENSLEEEVNLINARVLAEERGITIVEKISSEHSDFATLVRVEVESDQGTTVLAATTRGRQFVRLVRIGSYRLDSIMDGTMVVYVHQDKPGLIGLVGTVLGKHGVNIAGMTVGREVEGGEATGILAVDGVPCPEALQEIRADDRISAVHVVKLPACGEMPPSFG